MKRLLIASLMLSLTAPIFAQSEGGEPNDVPPAMVAAHIRVVEFLQLNEEQAMAWDELYLQHREDEQPLQQALRGIQEELSALFEAGNPDPQLVGELVIERHAVGEELTEIHRFYHEETLLILDEEQTRRLEFIARADDVSRIIPAFKAFELIR